MDGALMLALRYIFKRYLPRALLPAGPDNIILRQSNKPIIKKYVMAYYCMIILTL